VVGARAGEQLGQFGSQIVILAGEIIAAAVVGRTASVGGAPAEGGEEGAHRHAALLGEHEAVAAQRIGEAVGRDGNGHAVGVVEAGGQRGIPDE
jgi:hypothetical protein